MPARLDRSDSPSHTPSAASRSSVAIGRAGSVRMVREGQEQPVELPGTIVRVELLDGDGAANDELGARMGFEFLPAPNREEIGIINWVKLLIERAAAGVRG